MKIYEIITEPTEFSYYIIEMINVNDQFKTRRYYYISVKDNKIQNLIRIGSIGTLVEFLDLDNCETIELDEIEAEKISKMFHNYLISQSKPVNIDDILKSKPSNQANNIKYSYDNFTDRMNTYFNENKVMNYQKINKIDYDEILGTKGIK